MSTQPLDVRYYLAALKLEGKSCLVVGGGPIAAEKIDGLLAAGARVTVVAKDAIPPVRTLAADGSIELTLRPFRVDDLDGRFLAVAGTSDERLNRHIHAAAEERDMLVNVVDVPALCNFILPAVTRLGPIAIAVSTSGASPALAKRMRNEIEAAFGAEYALLAVLLNEARDWARDRLPTYQDRKAFFDSIVGGDPDPIEMLRSNGEEAVRALIDARMRRAADSQVA
ncbi:MAG: bifunctional precorrin-2 dehydrogenase/sirohydrochlorin ferrochelatase [Actinobacteria bacterium]|nr:bifunctional precorrin-2 dehydrogenase/sirohydrochlorin ferrochelatase [Actinomycetota bacterium]